MFHNACVDVREQLCGVSSLLSSLHDQTQITRLTLLSGKPCLLVSTAFRPEFYKLLKLLVCSFIRPRDLISSLKAVLNCVLTSYLTSFNQEPFQKLLYGMNRVYSMAVILWTDRSSHCRI